MSAVALSGGTSSSLRPPMLAMRGVSKTFGRARVLNNVDLTLQSGEVHALLGENGAGKSTLMKVLFGIVPPDAGEIEIDTLGAVQIESPRHALSLWHRTCQSGTQPCSAT
jgi:ribose transport system ATP-binding protein